MSVDTRLVGPDGRMTVQRRVELAITLTDSPEGPFAAVEFPAEAHHMPRQVVEALGAMVGDLTRRLRADRPGAAPEAGGAENPTIGRIVVYRSRTGKYSVPAIVSATVDTLFRLGVEEGNLPDLTDASHVHLVVFTPGFAGKRNSTTSEELVADMRAASTPAGGTYQEWDVPHDDTGETPGSWSWPRRV